MFVWNKFKLYFLLGLCCGYNGYNASVTATLVEVHHSVNQRIQCVVLTDTYISAGVVACTALTHDDIAGHTCLTTPNLNA